MVIPFVHSHSFSLLLRILWEQFHLFYASFSINIFRNLFCGRLSHIFSYEVLPRKLSDFCFTDDCFVKFIISRNNLMQELFQSSHVWIETLSFISRNELHKILFLYPYLNMLGLCGVVSSIFLALICLRHFSHDSKNHSSDATWIQKKL